ncbi:MAG: DUF4397 domain-containing protein [Saprospiraceae bacterium]|nr:DUF4397 domain-containing protein [Saprospiraceae bacterium]
MNRIFSVLFLTLGLFMSQSNAQAPLIQVIHNSPDPAAATVDIWFDATRIADDLSFRNATEYITGAAGTHDISITSSTATDTAGAVAKFTVNLTANTNYVVVADGMVNTTGYTPATAFDLKIYNMGLETAGNANQIDMLVHHGSTDAPTVDIRTQDLGTALVDDIAFGEFQGYVNLNDEDYIIRVTDATGATVVKSYLANVNELGLAGGAIVAVASGFLDPSVNNNGPAFGIWVAPAAGGAMVELAEVTNPPRVQIIHNSAGAGADSVDIYLDAVKVADNLKFREATAFIDAFPGARTVSVAAPNSTDTVGAVAQFPVTLSADETYIVVANGLVNTTGYSPAAAFDLSIYAGAKEAATNGAGKVDLLVHHGATDAPVVDVRGEDTTTVLVNDIAYNTFASSGYLELDTLDYVIRIATADGSTIVQSYTAPLNTLGLGGAAITVVASGFLDPSVNNNGPAFGLWVALASGGGLVELPVVSATSVNKAEQSLETFTVFPNPSEGDVNVAFDLRSNSDVSLDIINVNGQIIETQELGQLAKGSYTETMNLDLSTGLYLLRIRTNNTIQTKMITIK